MKLFLIFLIILIFAPIPLKFNIYYSLKDYHIKLYNIKIISKKKHKFNLSDINKKNIDSSSKIFSKFFTDFKNFRLLLFKFYKLKFKPLIRIKYQISYSLNDAAKTAIFYGVLSQFIPVVYFSNNIFFKTKKFDFSINSLFEDKFLVKIEISSIIFISIANIIFMIVILLIYKFKAREVSP